MKYLTIESYHNTQIVSTADLKTHLRITFTDDDSYIKMLERAAVRMVEEYTNRFLLPTECTQFGNCFSDLEILFKSPCDGDIDPVVSYRKDGSWSVISHSDIEYVYDLQPARCYAQPSFSPPGADDVFQAWKIFYTTGYKTIPVIPEALIQAIKIIVGDLYENRQSVIVGKMVSEIPKTSTYLMNPYRVQTL